jgi:dienelactone hydrolase
MTRPYAFVLAQLVLTLTLVTAWGQTPGEPESVVIRSGSATLHAMLWRPQGRGPFPAILLNQDHIAAPIFFIHAENDYSLSSGKVLNARRELFDKPHRLKIYPPIGDTVDEGHDFLHLGVNIWEPDVFAFLGDNMPR